MDDRIIWQPQGIYQSEGYSFSILLDPGFAKEMLESKLTKENYKRMQDLPRRLMNFPRPEPYIFHEDTCFVRQITLHGGDGKWLSLDDACGGKVPDLSKPVKYSTHNMDCRTTAAESVILMGLFDLWIEYSAFLKEK